MFWIFFLIYIMFSFLALKAVLFWVYLWQIKEYRLDRFWAEYGEPRKLFKFWILSGGRSLKRPVWTAKAITLAVFSFAAAFAAVASLLLAPYSPTVFLTYVLIYFAVPGIVLVFIFLSKFPVYVVKEIVYIGASRKIRKMKNLLVIGITGSYGKSSTKEFVAQILSHKFKVAKTPLNINSEIGVAKFVIKNLAPRIQIFVAELGAYERGEIRRLCRIIKPKIGILTGISEQHLALFGSLDNIKKAKFELIQSLPKDGLAVFNGECKYVLELAEKWSGGGIIYRNNLIPMYKQFPRHYELNLNAAIEVAKYLGMTQKEIDEAIKSVDLTGNMIKSFSGKNGALIIDDTYSANPDGVLAALDYLAAQIKGNRIIIMPCVIELGEAAYKIHEDIGHKIRDICDLAIITTGNYFEDIRRGAGDKAVLAETPRQIKVILEKKLNPNTAVLLEGRIPNDIIEVVKE